VKKETREHVTNTFVNSIKPASGHNQRQREKILKLAGKLFWQKGYLGTSMDDIASSANLNKATLYYYFKDKDQILSEIVSGANRVAYDMALEVVNSNFTAEKSWKSWLK
jgi:AcrR family transcriptional regulator